MIKKSVISLISYDAHYLADSIKRYYNYVDEIILGLDESRVTWSGNSFGFDESTLWNELNNIDGDGKISVIEGNFHQSKVAIENENYERNYLKAHCDHDWILSIDADEYLLNAKEFFYDFCPLVERYSNSVDVCMTWAMPYKVIDDTALVLVNDDGTTFFGENQGVLTSKDSTYVYGRWTNKSADGSNRVLSPLVALHWSICRNPDELYQKLHNTCHSDIAATDPTYSIWSQVTLENYSNLHNFKTSGLGLAQWPRLKAIPAADVEKYYTDNLKRAY